MWYAIGVIALLYVAVALGIARMCSINNRWEGLLDRVPSAEIPGHPEDDVPFLRQNKRPKLVGGAT